MSDRKVIKLQQKIRKLEYHNRVYLMDWLNSWYEAVQEEQE